MVKRKVRWVVNDEAENSIHSTKKAAVKEYNRLFNMGYKYRNSLEVLRHDQLTDECSVVIQSLNSDSGIKPSSHFNIGKS